MCRKSHRVYVVSSLLSRDGSNCYYCSLPLLTDISLEHLRPRSITHSDHLGNLVLAHARCNVLADRLQYHDKLKLRILLTGIVKSCSVHPITTIEQLWRMLNTNHPELFHHDHSRCSRQHNQRPQSSIRRRVYNG